MKCKRHPSYQAKRKPTADCLTCERMWHIKNRKKELTLEDVEFNLGWVRRRSKIIDRQFREELDKFYSWVKQPEVGCNGYAVRSDLARLQALYDNYHSLLAVAQMIESGTP